MGSWRHWRIIRREAFIESMLKRIGVVDSFSDIPATGRCGTRSTIGRRPCERLAVQEAVGRLMWLPTTTTPNISDAVRVVAPHSHNPTEKHRKEMLKTMAYMHGTGFAGFDFTAGLRIGIPAYRTTVELARRGVLRLSTAETVPGMSPWMKGRRKLCLRAQCRP